MERDLLKQPGWLRGLEVVTGFLSVVLGVLVLVFPDWGVSTLVVLLSFGLVFVGVRSISLVGYGSLPKALRAVSVITGILSLIFALLVFIFPDFAVLTLLILVSAGLVTYGFGRIFVASTLRTTSSWHRGMMVVVGVIDIILSIFVLVLPGLALLTLAFILALALIVSGAEMIVSGAIGRTWLGDLVKAVADEMDVE